ncbi:MAG TPA: zf-HC2 domain-containing protein [Candidatus Omnitrophota bacterium]|nr:zf-HC2 domain-containing protein [Candidatus Omnitrophota bacterium]HPT39114.1 zf-HC2 domain-containing protein [Candidatus Omnitrophota bacterium]
MEKCAKIKRLLSRYLDKETAASDTSLVQEHLDSCIFCKKELAQLVRAKEFVSGKVRQILPPDYLVCRLREKIASQKQAEEKFSWVAGMGILSRRLIPVPVTAVLLSLVLMILSFQQSASSYSLEEHMLSGNQTTLITAAGLILGTQS